MKKILLFALAGCLGLNNANAQLLDQSNTAFGSSGWLVNTGGYINLGQSFTAGMSGQLQSITISIDNSNIVYPPIAGTFALIIKSGDGFGGATLATENFFMPSTVGFGDFNIPITTTVNLTAGNQYSFYIDEVSGTGQMLLRASNDVYSGGLLYFNSTIAQPTYDMLFKTYMYAPNTYSSISVASCTSYTSPSGNYTWLVDGVYLDTIPNSAGSDSIITVNLTIDNMPFNTTFSNGYNAGYSLYQGMFINDNLGWNVCWAWDVAESRILKTTDGGLTSTYSTIPGNYIGGVDFIDANNGFACGNNGSGNMIAKSTDGGATWTPVTFPTGYINQLNTIKFNDALHGSATGYGGAMYTTTNGGTTWNYNLLDAGNFVGGNIFYIDNNNIWAVGYQYPGVAGQAFQSTDGGATWTLKFTTGTPELFTAVKFTDALHGYICGRQFLFKTTDGGSTWSPTTPGAVGDNFTDFDFAFGKYWLSGYNSGAPILYTSADAVTWTPVSLTGISSTTANNLMIPSANRVYIAGDVLIRGVNTVTFSASSLDNTICNGDFTTLVATGVSTYEWNNGDTNDTIIVSPTSNTTYSVIGYSGACSDSTTVSINVLQTSSSTDTQVACNTYIWIDGNTYTASNSTATHILTNSVGCDSVVTLNLTIDNIDLSVTNSSPTLTAVETGASYQWLNCGTGFSAIGGATSQSFTATANGTYAVVISSGACVDTSACEIVTGLGLNAFDLTSVSVYPNPSTGKFTLDVAGLEGEWSYRITSADGRIVTSASQLKSSRIEIDLNNESTGIYVLSLINGKANANFRLIKE